MNYNMLPVFMSLTRATAVSSHPIHRILSNELSPSLALESGNNVSMQNHEFLACAEGRKSHSCPDPSLITDLLEMASVLDYEEDSPSTPKSPLAQNQNDKISDGLGSVHDHSSSANVIPIDVINYYCPSLSIQSNATISALYDLLSTKIPFDHAITIIFNEKVLLNLVHDVGNVTTFGFCAESNAIQIIKKPDFVALLEMVSDLGNNRNIPWLGFALHFISNPSVIPHHGGSPFAEQLHHDDHGNLIGVDLSNLNLIGNIHLESLPQTVRSLDLSFNDLNSLNLDELRGKSVERLNVRNNRRCIIDTNYFRSESERSSTIKELEINSNQIFHQLRAFKVKNIRIKQWLNRRQHLRLLIVDGVRIYRDSHKSPFILRMFRVIEGVNNKHVIPWYPPFTAGGLILAEGGWEQYGVKYKKKRDAQSARYKFDLSGLGLRGYIDLGSLSRNIVRMDLSNNNLSGISFDGHDGPFNLRELNLQNNDNLRINLLGIDLHSRSCSLCQLVHLSISSNQLEINENLGNASRAEFVQQWMSATKLKEIVMDGETFCNRNYHIACKKNCSHCA